MRRRTERRLIHPGDPGGKARVRDHHQRVALENPVTQQHSLTWQGFRLLDRSNPREIMSLILCITMGDDFGADFTGAAWWQASAAILQHGVSVRTLPTDLWSSAQHDRAASLMLELLHEAGNEEENIAWRTKVGAHIARLCTPKEALLVARRIQTRDASEDL